MIDTHLHILPGVDDGPETIQESLSLARALVQEGIHSAIATPHYNDEYHGAQRQRFASGSIICNKRLIITLFRYASLLAMRHSSKSVWSKISRQGGLLRSMGVHTSCWSFGTARGSLKQS